MVPAETKGVTVVHILLCLCVYVCTTLQIQQVGSALVNNTLLAMLIVWYQTWGCLALNLMATHALQCLLILKFVLALLHESKIKWHIRQFFWTLSYSAYLALQTFTNSLSTLPLHYFPFSWVTFSQVRRVGLVWSFYRSRNRPWTQDNICQVMG